MAGIIIAFFLGKAFYDLAIGYGKSECSYAALAVFLYYVTTVFVGAGVGVLIILCEIEGLSRIAISCVGLSASLILCLLFYNQLKKRWDAEVANELANPDKGLV